MQTTALLKTTEKNAFFAFFSNLVEYLMSNRKQREHTKRETESKAKLLAKLKYEESLGVSASEPFDPEREPSFIEESGKIFHLKSLPGQTTPQESVVEWDSACHPNSDMHESYYEYLISFGYTSVPRTALVDANTFEQRYAVLMASDCSVQKRAVLAQMALHASSAEECRFIINMSHVCNSMDIKQYAAEKLLRVITRVPKKIKLRVPYVFGFQDTKHSHSLIRQLLRGRGRRNNLADSQSRMLPHDDKNSGESTSDGVTYLSEFRQSQ